METWRRGEAGVAQLVEQLTCNQQVGGSIPFASSVSRERKRFRASARHYAPALLRDLCGEGAERLARRFGSASEERKEGQRHLASRPGTAGPARRPAVGKSKGAKTSEPRRGKSAPAFGPASFEGRYPSGQREQTVNLSASAFGGSNPPLPIPFGVGAYCNTPLQVGCAGIAQLVERQPSKLGVAGSNPVSRS